jgi:nicotinate-nucleotide pyrophosphorylase (carboxylating)
MRLIEDLESSVKRSIDYALEEDQVHEDITSLAAISPDRRGKAQVIAKQRLRLAGLIFLPSVFQAVDEALDIQLHAEEGQDCEKGEVLATIYGSARSILAGERTGLNLLQHAAGIATITGKCVQEVSGFDCDILDTRKTLPGLRALQKYAVKIGGGKNHRVSLSDRFLIKNNHLALVRMDFTSPISEAIRRARALRPEVKIEVEVENLAQLAEALESNADLILLDNMDVETVREAVRITCGRAYLEASGGMNLSNIRAYAEAGVNGISIGALTHSVAAADICLRVIP